MLDVMKIGGITGWLSATGCLLASVTVIGSILAAQLDWWWADAVAALLIAAFLVTEGASAIRETRWVETTA